MTRQALRARHSLARPRRTDWSVPGATSAGSRALLAALLLLSIAATALFTVDAALDGELGWWGPEDAGRAATVGVSVLLALYAATFLAYWRPRRLQARPFALVTAIGLAVVSGVLGLASYWGCEQGEAQLWTPVNDTLALFIGNVRDPFDGSPSLPGVHRSG